MFLEFSDWLFVVDLENNRTYYRDERENRCNCGYCLNYFLTVDRQYPDLRYFLSRFGVDIEAPEALVPISYSLYEASYGVQGKILRFGSGPIWVNGLAITIEKDEDPDWFVLNLGIMELPWLLDKHPDSLPEPYGLSDIFSDIKHKNTPQQI